MPERNYSKPHGDSVSSRGEAGVTNRGAQNGVNSGATREVRKRGRPLGSKNRIKSLVPKELAAEFLGVVKTILPPEHFEEMRQAIQEGKSISVLSEAKITLKLMSPAIWQRLIQESQQKPATPEGIDADMAEEIGAVEKPSGFSRDLNERMKIYMGLLDFIDKSERRDDEEKSSDGKKPILEIFARRGVDGERLRLLVGVESGSVGGNANESGRKAIDSGTVPDTLPERQFDLPDNAEGSTTRVVYDSGSGDGARSVYPE